MIKRNTSKYQFKVGNKIVHGGISSRDLEKRESEHKNSGKKLKCNGKTYDYKDGHIVKVGNKTTKEAALKWERKNDFGANQNKNLCNL